MRRSSSLPDGVPGNRAFLIGAFVFIELPGIKDVPSVASRQLEITVTGRQYYWQFEYPNGVIALDTMRAPAGIPVSLEVTAPDSDVIHSWWIPALGGKIDASPDDERDLVPGGETRSTGPVRRAVRASSTRRCSPRSRSCRRVHAWLEQRRDEQTAGEGRARQGVGRRVCQVPRPLGRGRNSASDRRLHLPRRPSSRRGSRPQRPPNDAGGSAGRASRSLP